MRGPRSVLVRGLLAGAAGAVAIAIWYLISDLRHGEIFRTPAFLASALGIGAVEPGLASVVAYTLVHFLLFAAVGIVTARVVEELGGGPALLIAVVLGLVLSTLVLYGSVAIAGYAVLQQLGWGPVLAGNMIAGFAIAGVLRAMGTTRGVRWRELYAAHPTFMEGVAAGLIGATAVAAWFLIVDLIAGRLFFTPAALGSAVFLGATSPAAVEVSAFTVLGYTVLHVTAFMATGIVAASAVAVAERHGHALLLGAILLFVTFEAFSVGLLTILAVWLVRALSWWNIAAANLVAALGMGGYLYLRHPQLARSAADRDLEEEFAADRDIAPAAARRG